ncbi:hypothetical protein IJJ08_05040 [bacterium]|nr:hypothetical protein [bacterium]
MKEKSTVKTHFSIIIIDKHHLWRNVFLIITIVIALPILIYALSIFAFDRNLIKYHGKRDVKTIERILNQLNRAYLQFEENDRHYLAFIIRDSHELLFKQRFNAASSKLVITNINIKNVKYHTDGSLDIDVDFKPIIIRPFIVTSVSASRVVGPIISDQALIIIPIDRAINDLQVNNYTYHEFDGGWFDDQDSTVYIDKNLNTTSSMTTVPEKEYDEMLAYAKQNNLGSIQLSQSKEWRSSGNAQELSIYFLQDDNDNLSTQYTVLFHSNSVGMKRLRLTSQSQWQDLYEYLCRPYSSNQVVKVTLRGHIVQPNDHQADNSALTLKVLDLSNDRGRIRSLIDNLFMKDD